MHMPIEIKKHEKENAVSILKSSSIKQNWNTAKEMTIKAGLREIKSLIKVESASNGKEEIQLNLEFLQALSLKEGLSLNFKISKDIFELGPLLGIFVSKNKIEKLIEGGWDSVYWQFQKWSEARKGLVYFFCLEDIIWHEKLVRSYYWNPSREWTKGIFPLPQVIYDRCFGKDGREASYKLRDIISKENQNIKVYNCPVKIGKEETYSHLEKYKDLKSRLPEYSFFRKEDFYYFLRNHDSVFLKPDKLYKGHGIAEITKIDKGYLLKYGDDETNKTILCKNSNRLIEELSKNLGIEKGYILQKKIELASYLGNKFDIRVMLQKRDPNKWLVTGVNARIAPSGSIITSPRSGGKVLRIQEVLEKAFPGKEKMILKEVKSFSCKIGYSMEEKFGFIGELGIDLGIDTRGKIWLIEVNGKPLKVSFTKMKDRALYNKINKIPIDLGLNLAGFPIDKDGEVFAPDEWDVYTLKVNHGTLFKNALYLNKKQQELFNLYSGEEGYIQIGLLVIKVAIKEQKKDQSIFHLYLSRQALRELRVSPDFSLSLMSVANKKIIFGPTVGMTVSSDTWKVLDQNSYELKKTARLGWEKGLLFYCFNPEKVHWDKEILEAYYLDPCKNFWVKRMMPFPQVLYDQATYPFDHTGRLIAKEVNRRLRENKQMQVINSKRFFGKWQTYEAVNFFAETRKYLPKTVLLTPLTLSEFLKSFKIIYVKSNYGSFGQEVMLIEDMKSHFTCRSGGSIIKKWSFENLVKLYLFLKKEIGENAVLQQRVKLARIEERPFDMRILAQKNLKGQWEVTTVSFRIASLEAVVTNVSSGAEEIIVAPGEKIPYPCLSWNKINKFSQKVLFALESSFGKLGEVGLDVGMDLNGKLWLFEANSKPNTHDYRFLTTREACNKVYGLPLDYTKNLVWEDLMVDK